MKKTILSVALLATLSLSATEKQPYHINLNTGVAIFDDASHLKDGPVYGVSAAFYEKESLSYALQLGYEHLPSISYDGIRLKTDINHYFVNMLVDGEEELHVTPYLLIGGGYEQFSSLYEDYSDTDNQMFVNLGLGFKYRLNDYFNITIETKALGKLDSKQLDYVTTVGLDVMFGGKWSKKEKLLSALETTPKLEKRAIRPSQIVPHKVQKRQKKKWITPQVVKEMFEEKKELPQVNQDPSLLQMKEHLATLKKQMAESEAAMQAKLEQLEKALSQKEQVKQAKKIKDDSVTKEKKRLARLEKEARKKHQLKLQQTREKIASLKAKEKAKKKAAHKEALRLAKIKRAKERAIKKQKEAALARKKAKEQALLIQKQKEAKKAREAEELARYKAEQEKTDILHIANGMAVFAD